MNRDICLHAINSYYDIYYQKQNLDKLKCILQSKELLSRRLLGLPDSSGFNGMDYISLCDYQQRNVYPFNHPNYNSYDAYIRENISIMFPKDKLQIINPYIIDVIKKNKKGYARMATLGLNEFIRFTDLPDEVQVKDRIPLDLMCGITIPVKKLENIFLSADKNTWKILAYLNEIKKLLTKYDYCVPIYDIDSMTELINEKDIKNIIKTRQKKI